jgi:hypothetical protein
MDMTPREKTLSTDVVGPPLAAAKRTPYRPPEGGDGTQEIGGERTARPSNLPRPSRHGDHRHGRGDAHMIRITRLMRVGMLGAVLLAAWGMLGNAGEPQRTPVHQYTGQIASIKIDRCGLQPGTCEGSVVLRLQGGQDVALAILPGTWIKRGDQLVVIDELAVGNYIRAQAAPLPASAPREGTVGTSPGERALTLEETSRE